MLFMMNSLWFSPPSNIFLVVNQHLVVLGPCLKVLGPHRTMLAQLFYAHGLKFFMINFLLVNHVDKNSLFIWFDALLEYSNMFQLHNIVLGLHGNMLSPIGNMFESLYHGTCAIPLS